MRGFVLSHVSISMEERNPEFLSLPREIKILPIKDNQSICCFPFLQGMERRVTRKLEPFPFYHGILTVQTHPLKARECSSPKERPGSHLMHFKHLSCLSTPGLKTVYRVCICLTSKGTVLGWNSAMNLNLRTLFIKWTNIWHSQWTKKKGTIQKKKKKGLPWNCNLKTCT